ncbi:MAG: small-conductance mechanosensitive channel, partial [Bradyrhizobiaceae bacterium]
MSHKLVSALLAALVLAISSLSSARAEPPRPTTTNAAALAPEDARRALETLQDDKKRAQMIDTLRAIANASGPPQAATPAPEQKSPIPLSADGLGAQLLLTVSEEIGEISSEIAGVARTITHFPAFYYWIVRTANDPAAYNLLIEIAWKLALVIGSALLAEWVLFRLIRRPVTFLEGRVPQTAHLPAQVLPMDDPPSSVADVTPAPELHKRRRSLARAWQVMLRLPLVLGRLVLELLPVVVFVGVATALLGTEIGQPTTVRFVILAVVNA